MKYSVSATTKFKRDYKTIQKRGYPLQEINLIFISLASGEELNKKHRPHKLSGDFSGCWECHIRPDWLLIWEIDEKLKKLNLFGPAHILTYLISLKNNKFFVPEVTRVLAWISGCPGLPIVKL